MDAGSVVNPSQSAATPPTGWHRFSYRAVSQLLRPRTLAGLGAGLSLLVILGTVADWGQVTVVIARTTPGLLALIAAGHLLGFACRAARWVVMLRAGGVLVPWRRALAASFGADLLGPLPASPLVASYFLHRDGSAPVSSTVPVVFAGLWVDVLVVVGGTALMPVGTPPLVRAAAITLCTTAMLAVVALHWPPLFRLADRVIRWLAASGRRAWRRGERWWTALERLPTWRERHVSAAFSARALVPGVMLTALPMGIGTTITATVARTFGFTQLTPGDAWSAAGTMMVLSLASPLPFDLGVTEGAGVLAYGWAGMPAATALAMALLGRITNLTFGFALAAVGAWLLRDEFG
jgi:uncharacterized membrane protein YbhN (UPF0104 family)